MPALKNNTLTEYDCFRKTITRVADIKVIRKNRRGYFGGTEIIGVKTQMIINHAIFDPDTVRDLIDDLMKINPLIRIEEV